MPFFVPRLLLFAVAIVLGVLLLLYAITRDKRYLRYARQLFVLSVIALVVFGLVMLVGRIIRFS